MRTNLFAASTVLALLASIALPTAAAETGDIDLTLTFSNLAPLESDHYEGWLLVGGQPVSTGKFKVAQGGQLQDLNGNSKSAFRVPGIDLAAATKFVLSIEPQGDTDSAPAAVKPLAGSLDAAKKTASLSVDLGGKSLSGIAGRYILATPSDGMDNNEFSGVWFLEIVNGTPRAGLVLPDLTGTDWVWEGWVVIGGKPVSTGKFDKPEGADWVAPYGGTMSTPPFPGEDFLANAPQGLSFPANLSGLKVVLSIEPRVEADPGPFQFKPLAGNVPASATPMTSYDLSDQSSTLPTGSVTIARASATGADEMGGSSALLVAAVIVVAAAAGGIALWTRRKK